MPQQLRLQGEDVVEDAIEAPAFQAVLGDNAGVLELASQRDAQRPVDAGLAAHLGFLQQLQAAVQRKLPELVLSHAHVPMTSTLPAAVTRTFTWFNAGSP